MDLKLIEDKQLVERYLLGRLPPPEAKFFEQMIRKSPELADSLGLPEALRRTMQLLDDSGHEWREQQPRLWQNGWVPVALATALVIALTLAILAAIGQRETTARFEKLRASAEEGLLLPPTNSQTIRVTPGRPEEQMPTYVIGSRAAPTLAELRIDLGYSHAVLYQLVVKRVDGTYWGRIDNLVRDSNNEVRLALNSASFAAGFYIVEIEASNLRGEGTPVGRFRIRVDQR